MSDTFGAGRVRASEVERLIYDQSLNAIKTSTVPPNIQMRLDYGTRTDNQPDYVGYATKGLATSASGWMIQKMTYNDDTDLLETRQISYDAWDDRASASYE
jgi:hypothetical protein